MNPYTQDVINKTLPIMQQNLGLQQLGVANNATQNNAFGGSRMGVEQGVTQAQGALGMGQFAAGLNSQNFTQAQAAATGDITRNLTAQQSNQAAGLQQEQLNNQAASGLTQLGNAQNTANLANYGMLTSSGAQQQAQQQADLDANRAKFNQAQNYPYQGLGVMEAALGMTPYNTASTTQGTSNTQGTTQQSPDYMGFAMKGLDFLGSLSDRRMKTDITPMGEDPTTGIKMHAFRYKGDPKILSESRRPDGAGHREGDAWGNYANWIERHADGCSLGYGGPDAAGLGRILQRTEDAAEAGR